MYAPGDMSEGSKDTVRYFINIGGKDDFDWMSLKDFLKEMFTWIKMICIK